MPQPTTAIRHRLSFGEVLLKSCCLGAPDRSAVKTSPQHKPCPFQAKHLKGREALDAKAHADVRDLDPLCRIGRKFVGNDVVAASKRLGDQVEIGDTKERVDSGGW